VKGVSVPYKGTPEALAAVLGGHVKASSLTMSAVKDQIKAGTIKPLVIWSDKRDEDLPDVPNAAEIGFPGAAKYGVFFGLYGHRDMPKDVLQFISDASKRVSTSPDFKNELKRLGATPRFMTPAELQDIIAKAEAETTPVLKELGLLTDKK
jgi:tripartite-type tricarboxylate transporter receptor subunit TctC